jgi:MarR family transcriptional regulator, organic hydroperoxide resistance regulator
MTQFDFGKASNFEKAEESPGFLLWRASTLWRRTIENVLKPLELTHPQFVVLATIGWFLKGGKPVNQAEIGRHASLDPNTTSQILRGLQAKGLIERKFSNDERSKCSTLTKEGSQLLRIALPAVEKADAQFFAALDLRKVTALKALQVLAELS